MVAVATVAVQRGDQVSGSSSAEQRFAQLYARLYRPLTGYCYRLVGDPQTAADLAQEAFTRLFSRIISVREPDAWLYRVATNLCRDAWRDDERQRRLVTHATHQAATPVLGPDRDVRDLVERLPARLRDVVVLHYYADLPIQEVAQVMNKPVGTVKRRLHEARALLDPDVRST